MTDTPNAQLKAVILQYVVNERGKKPTGLRILSDGTIEKPADSNAEPTATENLEKDRPVAWAAAKQVESGVLDQVRAAIDDATFFDLEPRMLINYCKEDPPTGIWQANVNGRVGRIVVYDPRPKRSAELDRLLKTITGIIG